MDGWMVLEVKERQERVEKDRNMSGKAPSFSLSDFWSSSLLMALHVPSPN